ncbi:MAG: NAD(P)-dependent oxidoreductase [Hyphomonadaceae bacterium]
MSECVLVFGASGFVGRNLVERLSVERRHVIAVTSSGTHVPGATTTVSLDRLNDLPALPADTVAVHLAAYRYDSQRFDLAQSDILVNNTTINTRIFHFCAERKVSEMRLGSSVAVYPAGLAMMDDAVATDFSQPPNPGEAFYAWSKRYAEIMAVLYATKFGLNCLTFRFANPYGPYDSVNPNKAHVAPAFVMKALDSNPVFPIRGDPSVERDFTFVGDVVDVLMRSLAWRERNETYNLCSGRSTTLAELADTVMKVAGVNKKIKAGAPGAFGPAKRISTSDRLKAAFGVTFTSLEVGMQPTVEWYRREFRG